MTRDDRWIPFGRLTRPHGLRGELRLIPHDVHDELPRSVERLQLVADGSLVELRGVRRSNDAYLVTIVGVEDRDSAAALRNAEVAIDRADLPELGPGEFYLHELIGTRAVDTSGVEIGTVKGFPQRPGQELMALQTAAGERLLPVIDGTVIELDRESATVTLEVPEGLWE